MTKVETRELRQRLLWLLLAVELGMCLAAACALPLAAFRRWSEQQEETSAAMRGMGSLSSQVNLGPYLFPALLGGVLLLILGLITWSAWWMQRSEFRRNRASGGQAHPDQEQA